MRALKTRAFDVWNRLRRVSTSRGPSSRLCVFCLSLGAAACTVPGGDATGCDDPSVELCQSGESINGEDCTSALSCGDPGRTGTWIDGSVHVARVQCEDGRFLECSAPVGGSNYAQAQQPFPFFGGGVLCQIGIIQA